MKTLILYRSIYGSTRQYAMWIQEELSCQLDHIDNIQKYDINDYETIIVGEAVYAGQLKTPKQLIPIIEKFPNKKYIFFMVGIADMEYKENQEKLYSDLSKAMKESIKKVKVFFLRGILDYTKLNFKHKSMMWMLVKYLKTKPKEELPKDGDKLINTYGKIINFIDKNSIKPLIKYAKEG